MSFSTIPIALINELSTITDIKDGMTYELSKLKFRNTGNVFSQIAYTGSLVIKKPRYVWMRNFRHSVIDHFDDAEVRIADAMERNIIALLDEFPEFHVVQNSTYAHFLMVHKLQYQRIKEANNIRIPKSRFILVIGRSYLLRKRLSPVIVQEKLKGIPLIEMFDQNTESIKPQYIQFLPTINPILRDLVESRFRDQFNWYIGNFLYNPDTKVISYVDPKPSCIFMELENEQNIQGLREVFFASKKRQANHTDS